MANDVENGRKRHIRTIANFTVNDGQILLNAAINGIAMANLPSFSHASALIECRVIGVMPEFPKKLKELMWFICPANSQNQRWVHLLIIWHRRLRANDLITGNLGQDHRFDAAVLFTPFECLIAGPRGQICNSLSCDARFLDAVF